MMLDILLLSLATRITPVVMKIIARIPIPKKVPGSTRPLAICHDGYTFIIGEEQRYLQPILEEILPKSTRAFRPGIGTYQINLTDICVTDDAYEFSKLLIKILEDEEKFFDGTWRKTRKVRTWNYMYHTTRKTTMARH